MSLSEVEFGERGNHHGDVNGGSNVVDRQRYDADMKERLRAIVSLRDLVIQQKKTISLLKQKQGDYRKTISKMHKKPLQEIREDLSSIASEMETDNDISRDYTQPSVNFGLAFESIDEDVISAITCETEGPFAAETSGLNGDFKDAIEAIQEQASQIDTVIALDRLDTAKQDLDDTKRDLQSRTAEVDALKDQVARLEGRVASLQLERDLFEAEAKRNKTDLKACIQHMASRHFNRSPSPAKPSTSDGLETPSPTAKATILYDSPQASTGNAILNQQDRLATDSSSSGEQFDIANLTAETANTLSDLDLASGWEHCPTPKKDSGSEGSSFDRTEANVSNVPLLPPAYKRSARTPSPAKPPDSRSLGLCFWKHRNRGTVDNGPAFARMEDDETSKRAHKNGKRVDQERKRLGRSSINRYSKETRKASQASKAKQLEQRLANETRRADQLRKQLSSSTRHYDNVVYSLQQNVSVLRSAQEDITTDSYTSDMISQLSALDQEKRASREKLRKTEASIAKLKKEQAKTAKGIKTKPQYRRDEAGQVHESQPLTWV